MLEDRKAHQLYETMYVINDRTIGLNKASIFDGWQKW